MADVIKEKILTYVLNRGNTVKAMDGGELIRCKNCKHWGQDGYKNGCKFMVPAVFENDYCSFGEEKE